MPNAVGVWSYSYNKPSSEMGEIGKLQHQYIIGMPKDFRGRRNASCGNSCSSSNKVTPTHITLIQIGKDMREASGKSIYPVVFFIPNCPQFGNWHTILLHRNHSAFYVFAGSVFLSIIVACLKDCTVTTTVSMYFVILIRVGTCTLLPVGVRFSSNQMSSYNYPIRCHPIAVQSDVVL